MFLNIFLFILDIGNCQKRVSYKKDGGIKGYDFYLKWLDLFKKNILMNFSENGSILRFINIIKYISGRRIQNTLNLHF